MIIGIDLDGVTGIHDGAFRKFLVEKYEVSADNVDSLFPQPVDYKFSTWAHLDKGFVPEHTEATATGIYRTMDVMPGAQRVIHKLMKEGHHNRVITSRFIAPKQHARVVSDTALWLDDKDIPYDDIMFTRHKGDVFADVYIDDSPENVNALRALGRNVIVFDHLYNRDLGNELRAHNWDEVYDLIQGLNIN